MLDGITSGLTNFLQAILCAIENVAFWVLALVVDGINAVIAALALLVTAALFLMPSMPDVPELPDEVADVVAWIAWVLPVSTFVDILAFAIAAWLIWQLVVILLRWAKATSE